MKCWLHLISSVILNFKAALRLWVLKWLEVMGTLLPFSTAIVQAGVIFCSINEAIKDWSQIDIDNEASILDIHRGSFGFRFWFIWWVDTSWYLVQEHPELIKKYLGSVVPTADNYFAALNRWDICWWDAVCDASRVLAKSIILLRFNSMKSSSVAITLPWQCGLQRWVLLLHPQGYHVPNGDLHLLSHQQQGALLCRWQLAHTQDQDQGE